MFTATCLAEDLPQFAHVTNHYGCSDGRYLLVTVPKAVVVSSPFGEIAVNASHLPNSAAVFLADENAAVLDADGDPANGMTPLLVVPDCDSHADALAAAGFDL